MLMKVVTVPDFCGRSRIRKFRVSRAHVQSEIDPDYFDPPYANPSCSQIVPRAGP